MITLHRSTGDTYAAGIEDRLKDLVVAYKVQEYPPEKSPDNKLPFIREGKATITGRENIERYLAMLSQELSQQRTITGDACYIDPETGNVC